MRRLGRPLIALTIFLGVAVSVGGGATFVALEITTRSQFCNSCHIMEPYYESWKASSHSDVECVECHYEPGLLETFDGKIKALNQLTKYVTGTAGTKPWAEVSDNSCMRSGCHSTRHLEGEISFGRIRFDHRHHLLGFRRGKKLRCTSCHSQIVQGSHLTVTQTTCFLCHFKEGRGEVEGIGECDVCHGPPEKEILLGDFTFRHADYLDRGVKCQSCHGDVTRGTGEVPRARCGSCHNQQAHLDRYDDVEFMHRNHVTDHSVSCLECHTEIRHGLPPREEHYRGDCTECHVGAHGAGAGVYRGTGGRDVPDMPGVMYLARVTCNGCHRPPFPDAPAPEGGATYKADPLACIDCHGTGFEGMAERWQKEIRSSTKKVQKAVEELHELLSEEWEDGNVAEARRRYKAAGSNLGRVLLDGSEGVHNLPYVRALLRRAVEDVGAGVRALDPDETPPRIRIGPAISSKEGCTILCHVGIEETQVEKAFDFPFSHATHLLRARLDCATCHKEEPHGTLAIKQQDCVSCHHKSEEPDRCGACHVEVAQLRAKTVAGVEFIPMQDLDCLACHEGVADGHSREAVSGLCNDCHEDDPVEYETWLESAWGPVRELEKELATAPPAVAAPVRAALEALKRAGPHHNATHAKAEIARLRQLLTR